jgi:hypothetical protein
VQNTQLTRNQQSVIFIALEPFPGFSMPGGLLPEPDKIGRGEFDEEMK